MNPTEFNPRESNARESSCGAATQVNEIFHSLNQPLTSLRCSLELSLDQRRDVGQRQDFLQHALEDTDRVVTLVSGLREFLEAGEKRRGAEVTELADCLEEAVEDLRPVAESRGVRLSLGCDESMKVRMGAARLRRTVFYLLERAVNAAPAGAEIAWVAEVVGKKAVITGSVSAPATSEVLGKAAERKEAGLLRLAIARRTIEAAGGKLICDVWSEGALVIRMPLAE